jgi:hypothetical protein
LARGEIEVLRGRLGTAGGVAEVASVQHGAVARWQLLALGLSDREVDRRVEWALLHRQYRGVYLVGHVARGALTLPTAALLAVGPGGVHSHHTAGARWGWRRELLGIVDVTVPGARRANRKGLRLHTGSLGPHEVTLLDALPVTTPARTVRDLAAVLPRNDLVKLLDDVLISGLATFEELTRIPAARAILGDLPDPGTARCRAERRLLRFVRRAGFPEPELNALVEGHECDVVWRAERLVVEYDSWKYHRTPERRARDRRRQAALERAGWIVLRLPEDEPNEAFLVRLAQAWPAVAA